MSQDGDKAQAAATASSFIQISNLNNLNLMPESAKKTINMFLQQGADPSDNVLLQDLENTAPEANGYESQSNGVIDMLKSLQRKFVEEKTVLEKNDKDASNAHNMLKQDLTLTIANTEKVRKEKQVTKATRIASRTEKTSDKNDAAKMLAADEKYTKKLKADCRQQASIFVDRQKLRAEEIVAIEKAVEIISSGAVAGSATKHLPKLLQEGQATSLAGLRSSTNVAVQLQLQRNVEQFLQAQADKINSRILSVIALRVGADPMIKVKKMIADMIVKLTDQAASEATHKGQCDDDLAENKATRIAKTDAIATLQAEIDQLASKSTKLSQDIQTLTDAVKALDKATTTKTAIRQADTVKNKATVKDAQNAQEAIAQALSVLKDFYEKAGGATALVQQEQEPSFSNDAAPVKGSPVTDAAAFKGSQGESNAVLGMLEVIASDFARLEAETKSSEETDKTKYVEFMDDSKMDKIAKQADIEHKKEVKDKAEQDKVVATGDMADQQTFLNAALSTFEKLKPTCLAPPMSYEERAARRTAEVNNLRQALIMLESEASEDELYSGMKASGGAATSAAERASRAATDVTL